MRSVVLAILLLASGPSLPAIANSTLASELGAISTVNGLEEPLIRAWVTNPVEDQDLSEALTEYKSRTNPDDISALERFVDKYRNTGWSPSILLNVGLAYQHYGYVSRAEKAWLSAWKQGRTVQDPQIKALVDRAVGELALLYASLGESDKLSALFGDIGSRPITGSATEKIQIARETLELVSKDPRHLFNCGPLALRSLLIGLQGPSDRADALRWYQASPKGTNLAEIASLADKAGLSYRIVHRNPGEPVPVPSIVHFKAGHFATLLAAENGRYHIFDPVFGGQDLWLTAGALDSEASGHFLVPDTSLLRTSAGWREITLAQAAEVWGKGPTNGVVRGDAGDPRANTPRGSGSAPPPPPNCGMCRYDIRESTVGLTLWDIPVGYAPAIGPKVQTRISYNQREDSQPAVFGFYNVSQKWTLNWLNYIIDDPQNPGANVSRALPEGGAYYYTGYSSQDGSFAVENDDGSILFRDGSNAGSYRRLLRDGTVELYNQSDNSQGYPRRIFISKITDPQGNSLTFDYDALLRLITITDAVGLKTTFSYTQSARPLLVTRISDPFGRSATLSYDFVGRLSSITDVIGLTSRFSYDANNLVNGMTTPYGSTTFAYTPPGTSSPPRFLDITDPLGFHEREEWLEPAPIPDNDPTSTVPQGMPLAPVNEYLRYRNSFYWDKTAYVLAGCSLNGGCDYTKARIRHFVHSSVGVKGVAIESEKYPLENRVWYNYPGQTASNFSGIFNKPSTIARVLDDGTTQIKKFEYDTKSFNISSRTDPLGRTTYFTYAPNGIDLLAVTQGTNFNTFATLAQFAYNSRHQPLVFTDASGQTSTYTYNSVAQLASTTNTLNETNRFIYDSHGNLLNVLNANSVSAATFTYDIFNRIKTFKDSEGWTVNYEYDAADRIISISYPDGTAQSYTYDRLDLVQYRDRQLRTWSYTYDAGRRLTAIVDPSGSQTLLEYNPNGNITSIKDTKGNRTSWIYDLQNRLLGKKYADDTTIVYNYEATTSRISSVIDQLSQSKNYQYFKDDRLAGVFYSNSVNPTPNVTYADDPYFPRVITMNDGVGTTSYSYASNFTLGAFKLVQECLVPTGATTGCAWTVSYGYDSLGRMNSRTVSGSGSETVTYDALGRVNNHVSDLGSFALEYLGQTDQISLRQLLPTTENLKTTWGYLANDNDRRLASMFNMGFSAGQYLNMQFASTPESTISSIIETSDAGLYYPLPSSQTADFNNLNQLVDLSGQVLAYDANGNLLSDGQRNYSWDAENRLIRVVDVSQPAKTSTFSYDGHGRRVLIADASASGASTSLTYYVWCGAVICQARDTAGNVLRSYTSEGEFTPGSSAQRDFYGIDQLGSVRRTFASGGSAPAFNYDPYGNVLQSVTPKDGYSFSRMFFHASSGLYLTRYRVYAPGVGRWISRDKIDDLGIYGIQDTTVGRENSGPENLVSIDGNTGLPIVFASSLNLSAGTDIGDLLGNLYTPHVGKSAYRRLIGQGLYSGAYNGYVYSENDPLNLSDPDGEDWRKAARICYTLFCWKRFPDPPKPPIREPVCISAPPSPPKD